MAAGLGVKAALFVVVSQFLLQGTEGHLLDYKHILGKPALDNCTADLMMAYGSEELKDMARSLLTDMQPTWKEVLFHWMPELSESEPEKNEICSKCHENRMCRWSIEQGELKQHLNDTVRRLYGESIAFNLVAKSCYLALKAVGFYAGVYTAAIGAGTDIGQYALEYGGCTITAKIVGIVGNTLFALVGSRGTELAFFSPLVWIVAETQFGNLIDILFNHTHLQSHFAQVVLTK